MVVPLDLVPDDAPRVLECLEGVLPDTLFFETPKESLDHAILLGCLGRDEFLLQPVVSTGLAKPPTLKSQAVVATQDWGAHGSERAEPRETGRLNGSFSLLSSAASRELVAHDFPIVTINDGGEMRPAILATGDMRHVHGPPFITRLARLTQPRTRGRGVHDR